ncbi:MAG: hypothetical protein MK135_14995 [Polyangiaceae bacterium]|nr:hypothetical protein [Polyangiaceae bacterium]
MACSPQYRVGDHVLVEWGSDKHIYPAYIVERVSKTRFRVTFEGYPPRWDENVSLPRIKGWVSEEVVHPPPPRHVRIARGIRKKENESSPLSRYKVGDRLRVTWRESVYRARVLKVLSSDRILVHYEGHEPAWDEEINISRVVTRP